MTITVIRQRKKQQKLIIALVILIILIMAINYKNFFLKPEVEQVSFDQSVIPLRININFDILDSAMLKMLVPFGLVTIEFEYQGMTADGELQSGTISGSSMEDILRQLEELGLSDVSLGDTEIGRRNPFIPY